MINCDYKLFTNNKSKIIDNNGWDIVQLNLNEMIDSNNPVILSRIVKFQPWRIKELTNYDILIYCDAYWTPVNNISLWDRLFNDLINSNVGIIQSLNPYRNCPYEECIELIKSKKHTVSSGEKTINLFEKYNLPLKFGLWRNTFLVYLPKNENVKKLFDNLWDFYKDNKYTHRDQPLYSLAVFLTKIIPEEVKSKRMDHLYFIMNGKRGGVNGNHIYVFN